MLLSGVLFSTLLAGVLAIPKPGNHVLHEKRSSHTDPAWLKRRAVPSGTKLPIRIGMTQRNLDKGHDLLMDISDPNSSNYGKHRSAQQIHDLFAPSPESVDALQDWLAEHGITHASQSYNKQWLQFDVPVDKLEMLLKTKYHEYEHDETGAVMPACDEYHVPSHLQEHIDYITPGVGLISTNQKRSSHSPVLPPIVQGPAPKSLLESAKDNPLSTCNAVTTPTCVMALYNMTKGTTAFPGNQLGIFESEYQFYSQADLDALFADVSPWVPRGTGPIMRGIDGGAAAFQYNKGQDYSYVGIESNLDFGAAIPLVYPQDTVLYMTDDYNSYSVDYEGFLQNMFNAIDGSYCKLRAFNITGNSPGIDPMYPDPTPITGYNHSLMCGVYKPANVISISYGLYELAYPTNYLRRQCSEIMKLALQGTTVVASSGDYGVAGNYRTCMHNGAFAPAFPASCPYTLSVGSTYIPITKNVLQAVENDREAATTEFGSGGGFSNIFPTPSYQSSAVSKFFATANISYPYYSITYNSTYQDPAGGLYNRIGRGFPDVAAIGENFLLFQSGYAELIGGTSLSSPIFASILTRINEVRLNAGKATLGFVHPALYANPNLLHDIATGDNPGCGTHGFPAIKGWDPVTGLGTPKYYQLEQYFLSL